MVFRFVTVVFTEIALALCVPGQVLNEYQVKTTFLYNFAKFVEWPPEAFENTQGSNPGLRARA